uniref:Protein phosphatase 1 regulatory subunit 3B n=4 Tax=Ascaris suum TaxID=6253 RepID=F1L842_ASCSU
MKTTEDPTGATCSSSKCSAIVGLHSRNSMTNHCCSTDPCHDERLAEQTGSLAEGDAKEAHLRISFTREDSGLADACSLCASMTLASTEVNAALSPHKTVRFADDCGLELATVRVMTEPSDYPPMISPSVIRRLLGKDADDVAEESQQSSATWVVGFKQPASEYVKFRETLEKGMVALENVMLKNDICHMVGTVKVKNIAFEKRVFIRLTTDGWKSFTDRVATFQPSSSKSYDTFSFDVEIPSNGDRPDASIQFCVCYEAGPSDDQSKRTQYWDSNDGKNYELKGSECIVSASGHATPLFGKQDGLDDAYLCDYENWTKFASWKNLSTEGPYW